MCIGKYDGKMTVLTVFICYTFPNKEFLGRSKASVTDKVTERK
ncbi:hypothetical protein [Lottiidibacillus patelloidae]|nr:hypothetical protein [Lottiidibacillus patelloidae]